MPAGETSMTNIAPDVTALLGEHRPVLGPGTPNQAAYPALLYFAEQYQSTYPHLVSALWLWHNFLDASHQISQDLPCSTGSLLHAIMHRREPDAWNSKYWFRKVGYHPLYVELAPLAAKLGYGNGITWDAEGFVDAVEAERDLGTEREHQLEQVQECELRLLLEQCRRLSPR